jgi:hypothetical protein
MRSSAEPREPCRLAVFASEQGGWVVWVGDSDRTIVYERRPSQAEALEVMHWLTNGGAIEHGLDA